MLAQESSTSEPLGVLGATRILARWVLVVIPVAALSIYHAFAQTSSIDPEYTATASMLLTGPNELRTVDVESGDVFVEDINPLTNLGGSLSTVAEVTSLSMTDTETGNLLEDEGLAVNYNVWAQSRSPIVNVEAIDANADVAEQTAARLVDLIQTDLQSRQDALDAPTTDRIVAQPIDQVSVSDPDFGGRNRVRLGLAGVGVALSIASAFLLEGLYQLTKRYRERRRRRAESDETPTTFNVNSRPPVSSAPAASALNGESSSKTANAGRPPTIDVQRSDRHDEGKPLEAYIDEMTADAPEPEQTKVSESLGTGVEIIEHPADTPRTTDAGFQESSLRFAVETIDILDIDTSDKAN